MIREAKRTDLEYKRFATAELTNYLSAFPSIQLFEEVKEIVEVGLTDLNDDEDNDLQMKPMSMIFIHFLMVVVFFSERTCTQLRQLRSNHQSIRIVLTTQSG